MANFPNIRPNDIEEKVIKPIVKSSFNSGYEQTRPRYTRKTKEFTLDFVALTFSNADLLETFIMDNQGLNFNFVHPISGVNYIVRHNNDDITFKYPSPTRKSTKIVLKEV